METVIRRRGDGRASKPGLLLALLSWGCGSSWAVAQEAPPSFPTTSEVVVLDLVVRDKAGRLVTDLRPGEVEVSEDGLRCKVRSFQLVRAEVPDTRTPPPPGPAGAAVSATAAAPLRASLVLLAFDRLSPEAGAAARRAATDFVRRPFPPETWLAVVELGADVRLRAGFTQDLARAPAAIAAATTGAGSREPSRGGGQGTATREATTAAISATENPVGVQGLDPVAAALLRAPKTPAEVKQREMEARVLSAIDSLNRQRLGQSSLHALLGLSRALAGVEGRKTLLYFAEGLDVPNAVSELLDTVVSEANRANVTVYAIDPRGLVEDGAFDDTRRALLAARHQSEKAMRSTGEEEGPTRGVSPQEVRTHDLALDALRLNAQANLRDLAEATGGFFVADTNDLAGAIERVGADLRGYYEIGYAPANPVADGAFRAIDVKVKRRGVTVRTRRGYFALPAGQSPTLPYELALAQALELPEPPWRFSHRVTAQVGGGDEERSVDLVVQVPLRDLHLETDEDDRSYRAHVSLLVLVRDDTGAVVAKLSHDWPLSGAASELPAARQQSVSVRRTLALRPGRYALETAVQDRLSGALSASRTTLDVAQ